MDRNAVARHALRRKGKAALADAVLAMMDLDLTPTEIVALLAEEITGLAWKAAKPGRRATPPSPTRPTADRPR